MQPADAIPVTVLTGFLGAGKTTWLNRLLSDPDLADTAVIINEFGQVPIDHLLVETASDGVIELSEAVFAARSGENWSIRWPSSSIACRPAASAGWPVSSSRLPAWPIRPPCCRR